MTKTKKWDNINSERNGPINQFSKTKINSNGSTFKSFLGKNLHYYYYFTKILHMPLLGGGEKIYIYIYFFCKQLTTNKKKIHIFIQLLC